MAKWYACLLFPEDIPEFAANALEAGYDGPALRRLAGLIRPTSADVDPWMDAALREIGYFTPLSKEHALIEVGRHVAGRIVDGSLAPSEGCRILAAYAMSADYPIELTGFFELYEARYWGEYAISHEDLEKAVLEEAHNFLKLLNP